MTTLQIYEMMSYDPMFANYLLGLRMVADAQRRLYFSRVLQRSKRQIFHLKRQLRSLIGRYKCTKRASLLQNLAFRIDITEGMRSMIYEMARAAADELSDIYWRTNGDIVLITVDFDVEQNDISDEEDDDVADAEMESAFYRCV